MFHAARQDLEIVWTQARLIPHPVFDTQVAAMVCGFGESVSYVSLVKQITGHDLDKTSRFTDWARRPLSDKQLVYALGDVTHLRDIYKRLEAELQATGRLGWLDEEMAELVDPATYETLPEDAWRRLKLRVKNRKGLAVLIELAAWRERTAQALDVPRNRVLARRGALRHSQPRANRDGAAVAAAIAERGVCPFRPCQGHRRGRQARACRAIPRRCRRSGKARACRRPRRRPWSCCACS